MALSNIQTVAAADALSASLVIDQAAGNNRKAVVTVHQERVPVNITAPTLDGVTGTLVATITLGGGNNKILIYEWNDAGTNSIASLPASAGTYTIATTGPGTDIAITGISCSGAKQTACVGAGSTYTSSGTADEDPSFTLTADAGSLALIALHDGAGTLGSTGSGQTNILAPTSAGGSWNAVSYDSSDLTVSYTRTVSAGWVAAACAIEPAPAGGLSITSVTPSSFDDGRAGIVIAGSGFGASQGSSTLTIGGQAQTVTAWSDTSITFTSVRGSVSPGNATLTITKG